MPVYTSSLLLLLCWIASLAVLLIFLESWFGVAERSRFVARRASGAYGVCSIFVVMRGSAEDAFRTVRSIFGQSYPFVELFLIYPQYDVPLAALSKELRTSKTHVVVRLVPLAHPLDTPADRIRGLELAQPLARGRWYGIVEPGLLLDNLALEASLEFAGSGEIRALALRPGTRASSWVHSLLAPSVEYFFQLLRVVERRRTRRDTPTLGEEPFLLLNREAFEVVHRINRMPGILNEAGWSRWSYQLEGLRTFDGDGSPWLWRETVLSGTSSFAPFDPRVFRRAPLVIIGATLASLITIAGLVYGFEIPATSFPTAMIFALSAVSYALMTLGHFLHARKLRAAMWFTPLWFLTQPIAAVVMLAGLRRPGQNRSGMTADAANVASKQDGRRRSSGISPLL